VVTLTAAAYVYLTAQVGAISLRELKVALLGLSTLQLVLIPPNVLALAFDLVVLVIGGLAGGLFFFSQFTLPTREWRQRRRAIGRMLAQLVGKASPSARVYDGEVIRDPAKALRHGPGVVIVDSASAAVLHTAGGEHRIVGPGTHFLGAGESLAEGIDLRAQRRCIGPKRGENPLAPRQRQESEEAYRFRQARRQATNGETSDGGEVVPEIEVTFRIQGGDQDQRRPYGYDAQAIQQAFSYQAQTGETPSDIAAPAAGWEQLPARLAADLWHRYLKEFTLEQLFEYLPSPNATTLDGQPSTGLELIEWLTGQHLCAESVPQLDEEGNPTGEQISSEEFKTLAQYGLQVLDARLAQLWVGQAAEGQLVEVWQQRLPQRAQEERRRQGEQRGRQAQRGRHEALKTYAQSLIHPLVPRLKPVESTDEKEPELAEGLEQLARGALNGIVRETELQKQLLETQGGLVELIAWLRKQRHEK